MSERTSERAEPRRRRMTDPAAEAAYEATRLAFELGAAVRTRREELGMTQSALAERADMTRSAVARFEAGGIVPTLAVLERLAAALDSALTVRFEPRSPAG
ncbi:helix-turn-helix domain-containing protein [Streptoalloteichus hindustanus]|uniref:Helix-turn-helix domain-containing protein n=1 Tax=Streptoalloteichus hindustanus TaxID=2017 RepID=A0A1M5AZC7_STRHI|nr:helix-turn-helix transcriptional regulator [Streptoalloteichus hindustanus]SHF35282.1 Helix-turn-helix domain-containing protein [Streptoalloteichus hindustanus]